MSKIKDIKRREMKNFKKIRYQLLTLLIIITPIYSNTNIEADYYTKEGYCVVKSQIQKYIGLKRFKTEEDFKNHCNGKMIFKYKEDRCRWFSMKEMRFNILISDGKNKKRVFKIGERIEMCTNVIIEEIIKKAKNN